MSIGNITAGDQMEWMDGQTDHYLIFAHGKHGFHMKAHHI